MSEKNEVVFAIDNVTKRFRGTVALKNVSLELRRHEVLGLIGENGAGKSTLLKILTGLEQPSEGEISLRGEAVTLNGIRGANEHGIAMVFQEQSLISNISVGENVLLGHEGATVTAGVYRWGALRREAQKYIDMVGADISADQPTSALPFAKRQMVEVAKAIASADGSDHEPVILLDEPTSVLEAQEIEKLFEIIDGLRQRASVIFVSHRMEEVLRVCDRVYVLRDGEVAGERIPGRVEEEELYELLVGEDLSQGYYHEDLRVEPRDDVRLKLSGLSGAGFSDIDLEMRSGEVVALMGVQDSGREEIGKALFGGLPTSRGTVEVDGVRVSLRSPADLVGKGIGYIPSDRKTDGCVLPMSVQDNMVLAHPERVARAGVFDPLLGSKTVQQWIDKLRIKTPSGFTPMRNLSGGNQQKVVLAKWLLDPKLRVLILDTPTRGLDVGAKSDVYKLIRELAENGLSVILIADTLEEGMHMAHRVVTLKDGRTSGEFLCSAGSMPERTEILERMI
ncbi:sugar ABC transporter ATP-binding protein [Leucobacter tenebrionis]|uniref:sugar ABC transporter ATP-binding protein n=1 Tax=Leucobacter tenebrionis TaxID=2873270 RepID=UPI001CA658F4|nr:sugar ABC transporter ATP-binding protein [Leucobacter tenebrionis]QZY50919.1 sugar ABC transporter ATP-binding protein [Leucobacter tenebrionis]